MSVILTRLFVLRWRLTFKDNDNIPFPFQGVRSFFILLSPPSHFTNRDIFVIHTILILHWYSFKPIAMWIYLINYYPIRKNRTRWSWPTKVNCVLYFQRRSTILVKLSIFEWNLIKLCLIFLFKYGDFCLDSYIEYKIETNFVLF